MPAECVASRRKCTVRRSRQRFFLPAASKTQPQHGRFSAVRAAVCTTRFAMHDMDRAVGVIRGAIERGERIVVYGDYDVDGITATCTLVDYLRTAGAACEYYIPNRLSEG